MVSFEFEIIGLDTPFDFEVKESGTRIDPYEGSYVITPTSERQVLPTTLKTMTEDLVIEPIPSNYGLVSWNGTVLTVS